MGRRGGKEMYGERGGGGEMLGGLHWGGVGLSLLPTPNFPQQKEEKVELIGKRPNSPGH